MPILIERKRRIQLVLIFAIISSLVFTMTSVNASPECSYGLFDAWFSLDGKSWLNTTVTNISLECGQPFFVKAMMKPIQNNIWLSLYLFEPGTSSMNESSFNLINGPCEINNGCDLGEAMINETKEVIWELKVKDNPIWAGGSTPLSITCFFQKKIQGNWQTEDISFSIARIFLDENSWSGYEKESFKEESFLSMNLQLLILIPIGLVLIFVYVKMQDKRKRGFT
jgi:hypothetical protein